MNIGRIKKILDLMDERGVAEIEIRSWLRTVRISRSGGANVSFITAGEVGRPLGGPGGAAPQLGAAQVAAEPPPAEDADADLLVAKSPMVGTFYRAPAPDADPFVAEGDRVSRGQVLCIIEAMKIMNEIESEYAGTVVRIHVENAAPVEYGQPLFSLKPA